MAGVVGGTEQHVASGGMHGIVSVEQHYASPLVYQQRHSLRPLFLSFLFNRILGLCTAGILLLDIWAWISPGVLARSGTVSAGKSCKWEGQGGNEGGNKRERPAVRMRMEETLH